MAASEPTQERLNKAGRKSGGLREPRHVSPQELERARKSGDCDANEGRKVICLICGAAMWGLGPVDKKRPGHLHQAHGMTSEQYLTFCEQRGWQKPTALTSLYMREKTTKWRADHPAEVKLHIQAHRDRDQKKLTDADKAARVQCRLCGAWLRNLISQHLSLAHGISKRRYLRQFPGAPLMAGDLLAAWDTVSKMGLAKLKASPRPLIRKTRGRKKGREEDRTYFRIGRAVEERIPLGLKDSRRAIIAARQTEADANPQYEADVVAEYHKRYRRATRNRK
jgi:hypothetical protein